MSGNLLFVDEAPYRQQVTSEVFLPVRLGHCRLPEIFEVTLFTQPVSSTTPFLQLLCTLPNPGRR